MIKIVPTAAVFAGTVGSCWELVCWQCMTGDDPPPQNELSPLLGQEAWDWRRAAPWEATRQAAGRAAGHGHRWGGGWPSGRQKTAAAGGGGARGGAVWPRTLHDYTTKAMPGLRCVHWLPCAMGCLSIPGTPRSALDLSPYQQSKFCRKMVIFRTGAFVARGCA